MKRNPFMPDPSRIGDETLLRLGVAAALEFPDGSMSASGLRREASHGHLKIWRIAGKDYTTRTALKEMRDKCVQANHQGSHCVPPASTGEPCGSSLTVRKKSAQALAKASAARLRSRSQTISSKTDGQPSATVI
ncbi:MAG: hypothetical protein WAL49_21620, partial [Pseudolabrys sp.]